MFALYCFFLEKKEYYITLTNINMTRCYVRSSNENSVSHGRDVHDWSRRIINSALLLGENDVLTKDNEYAPNTLFVFDFWRFGWVIANISELYVRQLHVHLCQITWIDNWINVNENYLKALRHALFCFVTCII
jgi:hypothetical protein